MESGDNHSHDIHPQESQPPPLNVHRQGDTGHLFPSFILPANLINKTTEDFSARAVVGILFGSGPPMEHLKACIYNHWEPLGVEIALTHILPKNHVIFLFKIAAIAL